MGFDIYDIESANLIGSFETEAQALRLVQDAIARHGREYVYTWAMGRVDHTGTPVVGAGLADLALQHLPA